MATPAVRDAAIEIHNLSKSYEPLRKGKKAVDNFSLDVKKGEVFALLGPNGAGKTTLILTVLGLLKNDDGDVQILGSNCDDIHVKRQIGYLPENPSFSVPGYFTATEYIEFHASLLGLPPVQAQQEIDYLLDHLDLAKHQNKIVSAYSKGMLQRLNIAQAFLNSPDLLFLDEPILGLDPLGISAVRQLIMNAKKKGKTVFISSHLLSEVEKTCDRAGILVDGSLRAVLDMEKLAETLHGAVIKISNLEEIRSKLEHLGTIDGTCLRVAVKDEKEIERVVTDIVRVGGKIASVTPHIKNLEEYFVELVKE